MIPRRSLHSNKFKYKININFFINGGDFKKFQSQLHFFNGMLYFFVSLLECLILYSNILLLIGLNLIDNI